MRKLCTAIFLLVLSTSLQAQKRSAFDSLVNSLEQRYGVKIFYDQKQTSGLSVPAGTGDAETLLREALEGTGLYLSRDSRNRIYISRNPNLFAPLPKDFFNTSGTAIAQKDTLPTVQKEEAQVATADNKIYTIGSRGGSGNTAVISGYIRDAKSGEPLPQTSIALEGSSTGITSDAFGFYSITVPKGRQNLRVSIVGMKDITRQLNVQGNGRLDIQMYEEVQSLKAAVIVGQKQSNVRGMQMGVERLSIKAIKKIPAVLGETDILRSLQTLPGVTTVGEGTVGFNVRGGSADQNLVLLNDMTIYNPTHLFGFFSAVDPETVRGVELYKSAIPERLGGRLSSILDISTKDGNAKKLTGTAGLGPLTSKFTLEGPLGSEKTTFLVGGRATYSNWFLNYLPEDRFGKSKVGFYDLMLHLSHEFSPKDRIYVTGYISNDNFRLNQDSTYAYNNLNFRVKWRHTYTEKLSSVISVGMDKYGFSVKGRNNPKDAFDLSFGMTQWSGKADFRWANSNKSEFNFGLQHIMYDLEPGTFQPTDAQSLVVPRTVEKERGTETAIYLGNQYKVNNKLSVQAGLRYTLYRFVGPDNSFVYAPGQPRSETTIIDSTSYSAGQLVQSYHGPEIRVSARYLFSTKTSVKLSYNTTRQYIHMITNTQAIAPTDIWKLSDQFIKPQIGQQISLGLYTQPGTKGDEFSAEVYYKTSKNFLDYKSGAELIMNENLEQDVISTRGKVYGVELMYKKPNGRLNGWLAYTYLRTFLQVDDPLAGETINNGDFYPANFDKPHIVNLVSNYKFSQRFSISLTSTYSTGRPLTYPVGIFNMAGSQRVYYSERNAARIPDFFRTDVSVNIENSHKLTKKVKTSWTFGVYNVLGRDNPYSVYFTSENGQVKGYQLSVFASQIPFVTFNIRFN